MPDIAELAGLWHRSLICWPDGRSDATTRVRWLQGPSLYADLRQPQPPPAFSPVHCLRQVPRPQLEWLVRQEGFAGELLPAGDCVEWQRSIDFQPPSGAVDAGRLREQSGILVEEGRDAPYIEHWHRLPHGPAPVVAAALKECGGTRAGMLVRAGALFMFARARAQPLPRAPHLSSLLAQAADLRAAQDLIDCEVSLGRVMGAHWRIERSTLPWREGRALQPRLSRERAERLLSEDVAAEDGAVLPRHWDIERLQGTLAQLLGDEPSGGANLPPDVFS